MRLVRPLARAAALLALPAALAAQQASLPLKLDPRPTTPEISASDLMTRLYTFADDSMMGRATGTDGHIKSTFYIADELRTLGLRPAGEGGTYFQYIPTVHRALDTTAVVSAGNVPLRVPTDMVPLNWGVARSIQGARVVYGGAFGAQPLSAEQSRGGLVLMTAPTPVNIRALMSVTGAFPEAAGVAIAVDDSVLANFVRFATQTSLILKINVTAPPLVTLVSRRAAEAMLGSAPAAVNVGATGTTISGEVRYTEKPAPARNVVAILPGSDPRLAGQYVAIGSHTDHVGLLPRGRTGFVDHDSLRIFRRAAFGRGENGQGTATLAAARVALDSVRRLRPGRLDSIRNGADDDGSGSVTMLELAEAFASSAVRPKRSILFVWHTAEENGLLGSRYISDHLPVPADSIIAQLNMDMVGRGGAGDTPGGGDELLYLVGSRRLSRELGDVVEAVNGQQRKPFKFDYSFDTDGHPERIYCRSDHYNYARLGIPVVFFTTGLHGDYHQVTDEPQYIDYPHMTRIGQLVYDVSLRLANSEKRPVVDKPKPDPNGPCRQ